MSKLPNTKDKVFVDLGSGNGNIVIDAMRNYTDLYKSIGIELSEDRHNVAMKNLDNFKNEKKLLHKNIHFFNEDILDSKWNYIDFDIIYISNLCFSDEINKRLSEKINNECKGDTHIFCSRPLYQLSKIPPPKIFQVPQTWTSKSNINYYKL